MQLHIPFVLLVPRHMYMLITLHRHLTYNVNFKPSLSIPFIFWLIAVLYTQTEYTPTYNIIHFKLNYMLTWRVQYVTQLIPNPSLTHALYMSLRSQRFLSGKFYVCRPVYSPGIKVIIHCHVFNVYIRFDRDIIWSARKLPSLDRDYCKSTFVSHSFCVLFKFPLF